MKLSLDEKNPNAFAVYFNYSIYRSPILNVSAFIPGFISNQTFIADIIQYFDSDMDWTNKGIGM